METSLSSSPEVRCNTAIVGGLNDNNGVGAAWVFTRSNGVWTQQAKLVGNDAVGNTHQGISVALSGDGNTAIVGGPQDNNGAGAVWVFTRSGGQWTQQGSKLVGSDAVGKAGQGSSVALSGDGNLVIVDGPGDNDGTANEVGAAWLFARSDGTWSQLQKLANNGEAGFAQAFFGASVALSADGRTAMVGVPGVVNGGSFVFIGPNRRATDTPDFNGDGYRRFLPAFAASPNSGYSCRQDRTSISRGPDLRKHWGVERSEPADRTDNGTLPPARVLCLPRGEPRGRRVFHVFCAQIPFKYSIRSFFCAVLRLSLKWSS
jgi:FG-GAP repeat